MLATELTLFLAIRNGKLGYLIFEVRIFVYLNFLIF